MQMSRFISKIASLAITALVLGGCSANAQTQHADDEPTTFVYRGLYTPSNTESVQRDMQTNHPDYLDKYTRHRIGGDCILEGRVLNLITKERYYMKPTIITLRIALEKMKLICFAYDIKKLAMPRIGCGLDRLRWDDVKKNLEDIFANTDIEILVCNL